jgi:hypothetical protein
LLTSAAPSQKAAPLRYFAVWSYTENAPREEIQADRLKGRELGYWALEFDEKGGVLAGTYHAADGMTWLSLRYAEKDGRVYADLYDPRGQLLGRKSTTLTNRQPRWPARE